MIKDKNTIADSSSRGENKPVVMRCTLAEMIENDVLDHGIGGANTTDGFSIGNRGRAKFYMWDFSKNGFCILYEQDDFGNVTGRRYVDQTKTMVTVWKRVV